MLSLFSTSFCLSQRRGATQRHAKLRGCGDVQERLDGVAVQVTVVTCAEHLLTECRDGTKRVFARFHLSYQFPLHSVQQQPPG
mmetsp:Transcript_15310/g.38688  ORF Transcript_15310/g.38688 Transcript_15310/m.38688 type:complete len:83 (-) Transcript_15310:915-1163(-)